MNKITIPAILAATVLVAGIFAFMPVQDASTVHTTINTSNNITAFGDDVAMTAAINIIADSDTIKRGHICIKVTDDLDPDDDSALTMLITADGDTLELLSDNAIEVGGGACSDFVAYALILEIGETADEVDYLVSYTETNS